jgi:predicted small lipoprotein YifL
MKKLGKLISPIVILSLSIILAGCGGKGSSAPPTANPTAGLTAETPAAKTSGPSASAVSGPALCAQVTATLNVAGTTPKIMGFDMNTSYGTASVLELASVTPVTELSSRKFSCNVAKSKTHFSCYTTSSANASNAGYAGGLVTLTFNVLNNASASTFSASNFNTSNTNGDTTNGYVSGSVTYNRNAAGSCGLGALTVTKK